ncbi:hypothetical protein rosag_13180 [Roseisolibacter agri]|uniref:Uncharacterized protein n=1 Tax=Roseisolibacter agri TaxID=2014610 RepID=A0AA37V0M5_9BACT|nr:hypothetical protein rosag_13180 [Roseisolibacter agri]
MAGVAREVAERVLDAAAELLRLALELDLLAALAGDIAHVRLLRLGWMRGRTGVARGGLQGIGRAVGRETAEDGGA